MNDDIVTRLREECDTIHGTKFHAIIGCPPCEAADEIERLRAERNHLEKQVDRWRTEALLNAAYPRTKPDEQG